MAVWQITKEGVPTGALYDDRQVAQPGDPEFTTALVVAEIERLRADGCNYVGPSPDLVGSEPSET